MARRADASLLRRPFIPLPPHHSAEDLLKEADTLFASLNDSYSSPLWQPTTDKRSTPATTSHSKGRPPKKTKRAPTPKKKKAKHHQPEDQNDTGATPGTVTYTIAHNKMVNASNYHLLRSATVGTRLCTEHWMPECTVCASWPLVVDQYRNQSKHYFKPCIRNRAEKIYCCLMPDPDSERLCGALYPKSCDFYFHAHVSGCRYLKGKRRNWKSVQTTTTSSTSTEMSEGQRGEEDEEELDMEETATRRKRNEKEENIKEEAEAEEEEEATPRRTKQPQQETNWEQPIGQAPLTGRRLLLAQRRRVTETLDSFLLRE